MQTNSVFTQWFQRLIPHTVPVAYSERIRAAFGALIGLACAGILIHILPGYHSTLPLLAAPMGASAVLVFAVPSSPLAQPWSVVGGNTIGATAGVTAALLIHEPAFAGPVAVAVTIILMFAFRCVHPPSGAVALTAAFGGTAVHSLGYQFVAAPITLQSGLLVCLALLYHALTGHRYPHTTRVDVVQPPSGSGVPSEGVSQATIEAALQRHGELLDIDIGDIQKILEAAQLQVYTSSFKNLSCADIMSDTPMTISPDVSTLSALRILQRYAIKALPVVDGEGHLLGIVTRADLGFTTGGIGHTPTLTSTLLRYKKRRQNMIRSVRAAMTSDVCTVHLDRPISELVPLFAHSGHHHIPVVNDDKKVVGMITESDLINGLHKRSAQLDRQAA